MGTYARLREWGNNLGALAGQRYSLLWRLIAMASPTAVVPIVNRIVVKMGIVGSVASIAITMSVTLIIGITIHAVGSIALRALRVFLAVLLAAVLSLFWFLSK